MAYYLKHMAPIVIGVACNGLIIPVGPALGRMLISPVFFNLLAECWQKKRVTDFDFCNSLIFTVENMRP
jgi:hypothetical protein